MSDVLKNHFRFWTEEHFKCLWTSLINNFREIISKGYVPSNRHTELALSNFLTQYVNNVLTQYVNNCRTLEYDDKKV